MCFTWHVQMSCIFGSFQAPMFATDFSLAQSPLGVALVGSLGLAMFWPCTAGRFMDLSFLH